MPKFRKFLNLGVEKAANSYLKRICSPKIRELTGRSPLFQRPASAKSRTCLHAIVLVRLPFALHKDANSLWSTRFRKVLVQVSRKLDARIRSLGENGRYSPAKMGLKVAFAQEPLPRH